MCEVDVRHYDSYDTRQHGCMRNDRGTRLRSVRLRTSYNDGQVLPLPFLHVWSQLAVDRAQQPFLASYQGSSVLMEVDTAPDQAPAEPAPSQTLYVHNLAERPRKDGAFHAAFDPRL